MVEPRLSLTAELLWLSINPAHGGLLTRRGRRLRQALAVADQVDEPNANWHVAPGWRAGRAARRELVATGLVEPRLRLRSLRLTDRQPAAQRFRGLWERIEAKTLTTERDHQLAVLLAGAGVLAARLSSYDREIAWRRFKALLSSDDGAAWKAPLTGTAPISDGIAALGNVALIGTEHLLEHALDDLAHAAFVGQHVAGHHGAHDVGSHHGGTHHGGGHHGGHSG